MGTEAEFRSMLEEFLHASDRLMGDMRRAHQAARRSDVERAAHTLKSMARMVGATALADVCAATEAGSAHALVPIRAIDELAERLQSAQGAVRTCLA